MALKNTNENKKIVNRNTNFKKVIAGGVIVFSLATTVIALNEDAPQILDSEEYGFYSTHYLDNLGKINPGDYDTKFGQIYDNVTYSYNGNSYSGTSLYIISYDDGTVHLIDSDDRKHDLLTKEDINAKRTGICLFKESSVFYELYEAGIIKNEHVELSPDYKSAINNWDGNKHYQTVDLVAQQETEKEYQAKYGGK